MWDENSGMNVGFPRGVKKLLSRISRFTSSAEGSQLNQNPTLGSSVLDHYDPANQFTEADVQKYEPVTKRLRSNNKTTRQNTDDQIPDQSNAGCDLLGKNVMGISSDEFNGLQVLERRQLMEAFALSEKEFQSAESEQKQNPSVEPSVLETNTSVHRVPNCSALTSRDIIAARPSLNKFRYRILSDVVAEVTKSDDENERGNNGLPESRNEDGEFTDEDNNRQRNLLLGSDDSSPGMLKNILPLSKKIKVNWFQPDLPDSSPSKLLVRRYPVLIEDLRPLFRPNGLSLQDHIAAICDYFAQLEKLACCRSFDEVNSAVPWGQPISIKVTKGKIFTRSHQQPEHFLDLGSSEDAMENGSCLAEASESCKYPMSDVINREPKKRLLLNPSETYEEKRHELAGEEELQKIDVVLDSRWVQENNKILTRNSWQTKIGGGIVEDVSPPVKKRKTMKQISDDDDDKEDLDFIPNSKKMRVRTGQSRKRGKSKKCTKQSLLSIISQSNKNSKRDESKIKEKSSTDAVKISEFCEETDELNGETALSKESGTAYFHEVKQRLSAVPECKENSSRHDSHSSCDSNEMGKVLSHEEGPENKTKSNNNNLGYSFMNNSSPVHKNLEQCNPDSSVGKRLPPSLASLAMTADLQPVVQISKSTASNRLCRPRLRKPGAKTIQSSGKKLCSNADTPRYNEDFFSGETSEEDDCGKETRKEKKQNKEKGVTAFGKIYSRKKTKAVDQQSIKSFATSTSSIQKCPMCQKEIPLADIEEHVQECVRLDDEKRQQTAEGN